MSKVGGGASQRATSQQGAAPAAGGEAAAAAPAGSASQTGGGAAPAVGSASQTGAGGAPPAGSASQTGAGGAAAAAGGGSQVKRASQMGGSPGGASVLQSAIEYSTAVTPVDKKPDGKSMLAGPVDKKDVQRQSALVKQEMSKMSAFMAASAIKKETTGKRCILMRHGERLDRVFPGWMQLAFSEGGRYKPYDLNMPMSLPSRSNYADYANDGPLTEVGYITSQMCGRAMRMSRNMVDQIYCSPALRCIQSAHGVMKAARKSQSTQINVEPGLFEYLSWYKDDFPTFLSLDECHTYGYEINRDYKPIMKVDELKAASTSESIADYYKRSNNVMKQILERHTEGTVLVLAHGPSLDALSRELLRRGLSLPTQDQMGLMGVHFPYCSMVALQEYVDKTWGVVERMLPNISYYEHSNRINGQFFNRR